MSSVRHLSQRGLYGVGRFTIGRKPCRRLLCHLPAIHPDREFAAIPGRHLGFNARLLLDERRRPGGARQVVSNHAVANAYGSHTLRVTGCCRGLAHCGTPPCRLGPGKRRRVDLAREAEIEARSRHIRSSTICCVPSRFYRGRLRRATVIAIGIVEARIAKLELSDERDDDSWCGRCDQQ